MKTEKQLQNYLRDQCRRHGISFDKVESRSRRGFPDCLLAYNRQIILVEVKSPAGTGVLGPHQKRIIAEMERHGVDIFVVDSVDMVDSVIEALLDTE